MLYIPFINHMSTKETREDYLSELRRAGADRCYIAPTNHYGAEPETTNELAILKENISFYESNGFEVAVWIDGLGHGGPLSHSVNVKLGSYTHLTDLYTGATADDSFCPFDEDFVGMYGDFVKRICQCGAKMIMIDDDLRISLHGACQIACACPLHMAEFNRRAKEDGLITKDLTREELAPLVFSGEGNDYRHIWLGLQGDTMRQFCYKMRQIVDSVNPEIRLGHCACLPTWDVDGTDSIEMARTLAGNTKPFLRMIGAPYWENGRFFNSMGIGSIIELERMQMARVRRLAPDIEIFSEGDLYPRPRYTTPYMYAEAFHQALIADGKEDAILKYMLDYRFKPDYERGYIDRHVYYKPLRDAIEANFADKQAAGVYVFEYHRKLAHMDCTGMNPLDIINTFNPNVTNFTSLLSLPSSYEKTDYTKCGLVFGEDAKYVGGQLYRLPLILDALSAQIFTDNGWDVGLESVEDNDGVNTETFENGISIPVGCGGIIKKLNVKKGAKILSTFDNGTPACYQYENAEGRRFLVYAFVINRVNLYSDTFRAYPRQKQLFSAVEWMTGEKMPVKVYGQPSLYVMAKKTENEAVVGCWNCYDDVAFPNYIYLDEEYSSVEFIGNSKGVLCGDKIKVENPTAKFCFYGFVVKK